MEPVENTDDSWIECSLDSLLTSLESGSRPKGGVQGIKDGIPSIGGEHLNSEGGINTHNVKYIPTKFYSRMKRGHIRANDILIVKDGATTGKTSIVNGSFPYKDAVVNEHVFVCRPSELLLSRYLFLFLFSGEGQRRLLENFRGSAQGGINQSFAPHTIIPLPPIAEQKRIVAKVDELLAKVYAARDHLARAKRLMKRFRQSVLTAACTGRLGDLGDDRNSNGGQAWAPVYLKHLGIMKRGRSRHRPRNAPHLFGGPYPFIQTGDIANSGGRIRSHSQQYSDAGLAQSRLWPVGTVCVTIAANIADSAILTYPACFPDSVVGIIPDNSKYLPEFVELCVRTIRNDLAQFAPSTAQKNINISILDRVTIDIPPLSTQKLLVARAETLFSLADSIEARIDSASRRVEKLTQSILAKAFRGELVPTEAELARRENRSYEPASVLLDRIKSEREKVKSNGSGIKKVSPVGSGWRPSRKSRAAADTSTIGRSQSKRRS